MSATVVHSENGGLKLVGSNTLAHPTGYTSVDRTGLPHTPIAATVHSEELSLPKWMGSRLSY